LKYFIQNDVYIALICERVATEEKGLLPFLGEKGEF